MIDVVSSDLPLGALFSEDAPFPCFLIEADTHKVIWANDAAQNWTGLSMRRLGIVPIWSTLNLAENPVETISDSHAKGAAVTIRDCEIRLSDKTGEDSQLCHLSAFPTQGHIGIGIRFAKAQPRTQRMGGQLVSGMGRLIAHELKNPLAGIKGAAQLLRDDIETEEGQALIDLITSEIDRIRRLADRMETLGDHDPEIEERVNIHEILRRARRIVQSADSGLIISERYDPSLPHAAGDPDTLMQALLNLIKNASEAGTEITLKTKFRSGVSMRSGEVGAAHNLPIEIQIIDNGPGIEQDLIDQIFQPFVSTKKDGQGLGLALVSKVAAAHGGVVEVHSRPGKTKFSLLLPVPKELKSQESSNDLEISESQNYEI